MIKVAGLSASIAGNVVELSLTSGIEVGALPPSAVVEITQNEIHNNVVGITIRADGAAAKVENNNITHTAHGMRHVGLVNESDGTVYASITGGIGQRSALSECEPPPHPVDAKIYAMEVQDSGGGHTSFIEFLCGP